VAESAVLDLSCSPPDLTSVAISGPCAAADASTAPSDYVRGNQITLFSGDGVECHVTLTFADGFVYSADVKFTSTTDSCGTETIKPTQSTFKVKAPGSTCADAGG
jgi:hypothetical protein